MKFLVRSIVAGENIVRQSIVDAADEGSARMALTALGHTVLSLRRDGLPAWSWPARPALDVAWWCRELRTLIGSGMTVVEAIETLAEGGGDAPRETLHRRLLTALHEGQPLSRAMRDCDAFPQVLVASVAASERTSTLAEALDDYLRYHELLEQLRRRTVSAALYPSIVVILGMLISAFLLLFVIPRFAGIYGDVPHHVSVWTRGVIGASRLLREHSALLGVLLATALVGAAIPIRSGRAMRALVAACERIPSLRQPMDEFRLAQLYQALALMLRGGYPLDDAMAVAAGLRLGERMRAAVALARADMARGKPASEAFAAARLTSTVTGRLLRVGERTGEFARVLQTVAERHAASFATFVERATRLVEPVLLLAVALLIGGLVVMMYMPIFDMAGTLSETGP